jgi:hypothetical protein
MSEIKEIKEVETSLEKNPYEKKEEKEVEKRKK